MLQQQQIRKRHNTLYCYITHKDMTDLRLVDIDKKARQEGNLQQPYHFYIKRNGIQEDGRPVEVFAGHELENPTQSIHILLDTKPHKKPSDAQRLTLSNLVTMITAAYPKITFIYK